MSRLLGFGLVVFGVGVAVLMITGCIVSDPHLMGAAVILGVPFFACLTLGVLHDLDRTDRVRADAAARLVVFPHTTGNTPMSELETFDGPTAFITVIALQDMWRSLTVAQKAVLMLPDVGGVMHPATRVALTTKHLWGPDGITDLGTAVVKYRRPHVTDDDLAYDPTDYKHPGWVDPLTDERDNQ